MDAKGRFELERLLITTNACDALVTDDIVTGVGRHARGDWGDLSLEDAARNELSLKEGLRLLSAYRTTEGIAFWVITDADGSCTVVRLPEDY